MEIKNENQKSTLFEMAKEWQCENNQMVLKLINQYEIQYALIERLYDELSDPECTFYDTREDRYHGAGFTLNPLLKEVSKLTDSCNKTASLIVTTIEKVGIKPIPKKESALEKFLNEDDEDGGTEEE